MALQKQTFTLDFGFGGLDQKTDPKLVQRVKFSEILDARFTKTGRVEQRRAYDTFSAHSMTVDRLFVLNGQVMAASQTAGYREMLYKVTSDASVSQTAAASDGRPADSMPFAEVVARTIGPSRNVSTEATFGSWDYAESASCIGVTYSTTSGGSGFVEIYAKSGGLLRSFALAGNGSWGQIAAHPDGRNEFVVLVSAGNPSLAGSVTVYVCAASSTTLAVATSFSDTHTAYGWDMAVRADLAESTSAKILVAKARGAAGVKFHCAAWPAVSGSGSAASITSIATASAVTTIAAFGFSEPAGTDDYRVAWNISATTIWSATLSATVTAILGPAAVLTTSATPNQLCGVVLGDNTSHLWVGGATMGGVSVYAIDGSNAASTVVNNVGGRPITTMLTRPMGVSTSVSGQSFAWCAYSFTTNEAAAFLVGVTQPESIAEVKARALHLRSWQTASAYNRPPCSMQWSTTSGQLMTALQQLNRSATIIGGDSASGDWGMVEVSANPNDGWRPTTANRELMITGGFSSFLNGVDPPLPAAPLLFPVITSNGTTSSGGALTAGSYQVSGFYEYSDNNGMVRRSETAEPVTMTLSGTQVAFSVTVRNYCLGDGLSGRVRFVATRTLVNESQVYYRDSSYSTTSTTSSMVVSFTVSDATLSAREPQYTTGGIFDDSSVSCPIAFATNGRRFLAVSGDDPNFVVESKPARSGYGVAFMDGVGRRISSGGDRIYALASYQERWFAFKRDGVFVASGDGADPTGQNDTLSEFEQLQNCPGCVEPESILVTSIGIVYLSPRGFYLIGGDLGARYIGADIEEKIAWLRVGNGRVVGSCYDPVGAFASPDAASTVTTGMSGERCVFVLADDRVASDGDALVLTVCAASDLRWSIDSLFDPIYSIVAYDGRIFTALGDNNPPLLAEANNSHTTPYATNQDGQPLIATTAWVPMGGIQGFGRLYKASVIGNVSCATTVTVEVGYDFSASWSETYTISTASMVNGEFEFPTQRTRCQAVRFRITQPVSTTAAGYALNQIQLTVGIKDVANKLPASAKARKS